MKKGLFVADSIVINFKFSMFYLIKLDFNVLSVLLL